MKKPSRRTLLIFGVVLVLVAHLVIRFLDAPAKTNEPAPGSDEAVATATQEIAPSVSTLAAMGYEWQQHINALPPEARPAAQARLDQEKEFFKKAFMMSEEEREKAVKQHLEELMNDPEVQTVMAEDRLKKMAKLPPKTRQKLMKSYVDYKAQVTGR